MPIHPRPALICLLLALVMSACIAADPAEPEILRTATLEGAASAACFATEPLRIKPPEDSAVSGSPEFGLYFANQDRSILASADWTKDPEIRRAGEEGVKIGWFRPAGAELEITGRRLNGEAQPLQTHVPCCYPTRFQASGVSFPTEGCWEVTARATKGGDIQESTLTPSLSFVVWIDPE